MHVFLVQLILPVISILHRIPYIERMTYISTAITVALIMCMMFFMNYKMFVIAKKKRRATHDNTIKLKRNFTCVWVIVCFLICTIPLVVYCALKFGASNVIRSENVWTTFRLWASTIATMNCTFNCVILSWRNRILRRKLN
jgi:ABC-type Fe3+ transport system permease subunit